ncbi:hypothetical protein FEMY_24100 [Ferrovum myxofaciens]|uniref:Uncharacterized protein n=1 Tax=Ferrovum myxofaciens TaxID=416213 RepID=A0A149VVX0_9PROT|nr:hypothetical protein [Ferrovum myxofaciens]KXW57074.1 hypothetical protein FEMY_24100 [Ferrovum myxofaciens]
MKNKFVSNGCFVEDSIALNFGFQILRNKKVLHDVVTDGLAVGKNAKISVSNIDRKEKALQTEAEDQFVQKNQPNEMTGGEHLPSLDLAQPAVPVITRTERKNDADDKIRHGTQNPKIEKTDATIDQYKKRVVGILRQIASESNMEEITPSMIVHWLSRHAKYQTS